MCRDEKNRRTEPRIKLDLHRSLPHPFPIVYSHQLWLWNAPSTPRMMCPSININSAVVQQNLAFFTFPENYSPSLWNTWMMQKIELIYPCVAEEHGLRGNDGHRFGRERIGVSPKGSAPGVNATFQRKGWTSHNAHTTQEPWMWT